MFQKGRYWSVMKIYYRYAGDTFKGMIGMIGMTA